MDKFYVVQRGNNDNCLSIGYQVQTKGNLLTTHYVAHITDGHKNAKYYAHLFSKSPQLLDLLKRILSGISDEATGIAYDTDMEDRVVEAINIISDIEG
jgi:hypothetical protein